MSLPWFIQGKYQMRRVHAFLQSIVRGFENEANKHDQTVTSSASNPMLFFATGLVLLLVIYHAAIAFDRIVPQHDWFECDANINIGSSMTTYELQHSLYQTLSSQKGYDLVYGELIVNASEKRGGELVWFDNQIREGCNEYYGIKFSTGNAVSDPINGAWCCCNCDKRSDFHVSLGGPVIEFNLIRCTLVVALGCLSAYVYMHWNGCIRNLITFCPRVPCWSHVFGICRTSKDSTVVQEARRQRCQFAEKCVSRVCVVIVPSFGFLSLRLNYLLHKGAPLVFESGSLPTDHIVRANLVNSDILPFMFACIVFLLLHRSRSCLNTEALDCANVALSAMWIWVYCTRLQEYYVIQSTLILSLRIIQGIILGNPSLIILLHCFVSLFDVLVYFRWEFLGNRGLRGLEQQTFICAQFIIAAMVALLTWSFEALMTSEAEALLEARRSDRASTLVKRLLTAMSDAVVHLDANLHISEPCPKFASLMLRLDSLSMVSRPFVDFLDAGDRERFVQYMSEEAKALEDSTENAIDGSTVRVIHVKLLDANCKSFPVEVFASFIQGLDGKSLHVVGVKEVLEDGREIVTDRAAPLQFLANLDLCTQSDRFFSDAVLERQPSSIGSSSSSGTDNESSSLRDLEIQLPSFHFMLLDSWERNRLRVEEYSPAFSLLFGPSAGLGFDISTWIWPKNALEDALDLASLATAPVFSVQFRPAHLQRMRSYINADIELKVNLGDNLEAPDNVDGDDDERDNDIPLQDVRVLAILRNVKFTRRKCRQRIVEAGRRQSRSNRISLQEERSSRVSL